VITIQASLGEVLDKITILALKQEKLEKPEALANVSRELEVLRSAISYSQMADSISNPMYNALAAVNRQLWLVEDELREMESSQIFDSKFVERARSVYRLNDRRAALKRELNILYGSTLIEEKSYKPYLSDDARLSE
jgi:hypothetical protein